MNNWKIAFGICLTLLLFVSVFGVYSIIDQGVTLTYLRDNFTKTENDLNNLSKIINDTDLSKTEIKKVLRDHYLFEYMDFTSDTISLDKVSLIFKDDKLLKVSKQ